MNSPFLPRRAALHPSALIAASIALPALMLRPALAQTPRRPTPSQSEGPFYPDQALHDADADLLKNGKVKLGSKELLTTQMYVAGEAANGRDFLTRSLSSSDRNLLEARFTRDADVWQTEFGIFVKT